MAVKWSTPGIATTENDQSIQSNTTPGIGRGAIVMNANKGYVNQRVLSTDVTSFYQNFGEPDNVNQYGHFAAANFFANGSTQLLAVRATNGDEGYSQIQYPYTDASVTDTNTVSSIQQLSFIDNSDTNNIVLIDALSGLNDPQALQNLSVDGWNGYDGNPNSASFALSASSKRLKVNDLFDDADDNGVYMVYRYTTPASAGTAGEFYSVPNNSATSTMVSYAITDSGIAMSALNFTLSDQKTFTANSSTTATIGFYIDQKNALNPNQTGYYSFDISGASAAMAATAISGTKIGDIYKSSFLPDSCISEKANYVTLVDWDDLSINNYTVANSALTAASDVKGIEFKEYGLADYTEDLIVGDVTAEQCSTAATSAINNIANEYGIAPTNINTSAYAILSYYNAYTDETDSNNEIVKLVYVDSEHKDGYSKCDTTFIAYNEYNSKVNMTIDSVYKASAPEPIVAPWQVATDITTNTGLNKMIAMSTSQVMSDPTGQWADGFTPSCDTDAEPGNGDIESFEGLDDNLVIGAFGPGEFGNNIGISIISPEAAKYPALYNQNAFSWKYSYDDEDKVNNALEPNNYESNAEDLTWKKVYRINVYQKAKDKTASVWGFGLDAITSDPAESWYVSNDPQAKDSEGNSLYAPYVINGRSNYIYVSKKSVQNSIDRKGKYKMPAMTWSIYQMTGGKNSTLNNIKEKTAALNLYTDTQKAAFDILFNVEAIDTFNGKQRYSSMQRRIAEIASNREKDIAVIQVTSKNAKTIKLELSEGKVFSFNKGSYVAAYAGYDKYYDSYTANWVFLPKSVAAACAMAYCDAYSYPWMAPAGISRGGIGYSNGVLPKNTDNEIGQLYDNNINTSRTCAGYGEVLWCQKTMLKKISALNRINVRRLLNYIENNLESILVPYLYQNNTTNTRTSMYTVVDAFLSRIQAAEGLISKSVAINTDPDDSHIVYVDISLVPAESIEWINVRITINRNTGVTATEV